MFYKIILFCFSVLFGGAVLSQTFSTSYYTIDDGLIQSQIRSIGQDKNGYMWFGSYTSGASKFDGQIFETKTIDNGLCANTIHEMLVDSKQNLWFGTYGEGVCKYNGTNYTVIDELRGTKIYSMFEDTKGRLFFGTDSGAVMLDNGQFIDLHEKYENYKLDLVRAIEEGPDGEIYLGGTRGGIAILNKDKIRYLNLDQQKLSVFSLHMDSNKTLWIGTKKGIYTSYQEKLVNYSQDHITKDGIARCIYEDDDGTIWIGSTTGLFQIQNGSIKEVFLNGQTNTIEARQFYKDREGNLWIATQIGVFLLKRPVFTNYTEWDGLPHNYVFSIQKYNNQLMLGGYEGGISILKNNKITLFPLNSQLKNDCIFALEVEPKTNTLLIGSKSGVDAFKDGKLISRPILNVLDGIKVYDLMVDSQNRIWAATSDHGLFVIVSKDSSFQYKEHNGLSNDRVFSVTEDLNGIIWATTNNGISRIDRNGNIQIFNEDNGVLDNRCMDLVIDKHNNLWISHNTGISHFNGKTFKTFTTKQGLSSSSIFLLAIDNDNNLWLGNNKTLDKIDLNTFYTKGNFTVKTYDKSRGYIGLESNQKSAFVDGSKVWFGSINGITVFDSKKEIINPNKPTTILTGLHLFFDQPMDFKNDLELDYKNNHVTFSFAGLSFYSPSKTQYSYILEGADEKWSPPSNRTSATFANLAPGHYTFKLKASNEDGVWSDPISYSFTIVPPFWKTTWFYILCALSIVIGIYLFIRYRTKKLHRDKILLEKEVMRRTQELNSANTVIEKKNKDITDSINYAKRIQSAMLPDDIAMRKSLNSYFYLYKPKDIVSGDFYWFYDFGDTFVCAVGDCTGHGVPGALMSVICVTQINKHVKSDSIKSPEEALNKINIGIVETLKQQNVNIDSYEGMDIAMVAFNKTSRVLNYTGAYRPLIVVRNHELLEFEPNRFSLGGEIIEEDRFKGHQIQLQENDCVYMYSDGYPDQFGGERGKKFKTKKFKDLLVSISSLPLGEQKEILEQTFVEWMKDLEQVDDILVFGFKV